MFFALNCTSKSRQTQSRKYGDKHRYLLQQTNLGIKYVMIKRIKSIVGGRHAAARKKSKTFIQNVTIILKLDNAIKNY